MLDVQKKFDLAKRAAPSSSKIGALYAARIAAIAFALSMLLLGSAAHAQNAPTGEAEPASSTALLHDADAAIPAAEQLPLGQGVGDASRHSDKQTAQQNSSMNAMVLQTLGALGLVLAGIFATRAVVMRTRGSRLGAIAGARAGAQLELVDQLSIGPGRQIVMIRVAGRLLVVGDSPAGLQTLGEFNQHDAASEADTHIAFDADDVAEAARPVAMTAADIDSLLAGLRERRQVAKQGVGE